MPEDRSLSDIFTDILVQYRTFIIKSDKLIAEAKEAIKKQENEHEAD